MCVCVFKIITNNLIKKTKKKKKMMEKKQTFTYVIYTEKNREKIKNELLTKKKLISYRGCCWLGNFLHTKIYLSFCLHNFLCLSLALFILVFFVCIVFFYKFNAIIVLEHTQQNILLNTDIYMYIKCENYEQKNNC